MIIKHAHVKVGHTDPKTGVEVFLGEFKEVQHEVRAGQSGFLPVAEADKEGWFRKQDAVLIDDAVDYFTHVTLQSIHAIFTLPFLARPARRLRQSVLNVPETRFGDSRQAR